MNKKRFTNYTSHIIIDIIIGCNYSFKELNKGIDPSKEQTTHFTLIHLSFLLLWLNAYGFRYYQSPQNIKEVSSSFFQSSLKFWRNFNVHVIVWSCGAYLRSTSFQCCSSRRMPALGKIYIYWIFWSHYFFFSF